ncbi:translesion error-prone DNA polymerase V autoproteolytic subunit [Lentisphaerota bacterium ZTH]|nr:translesion error-prone DNA polymerase V autoproteolytic subunit [Lentisphaerota bacterium]WET07289.1 translesion error-prone DNA polymerase V autoproteolytic subunit [Lentisphaerota bacterium ZTH]
MAGGKEFERFGHKPQKKHVVLAAGSVQAGFPSPAQDYLESPLNLNDLLIPRPAATFFIRAAGDSMLEAGICDGDILVVDRSLDGKDGNVVIAVVNNEFTVKILSKTKSVVKLKPANPKYKPIELHGDEECRLWGVVTAVIHCLPH